MKSGFLVAGVAVGALTAWATWRVPEPPPTFAQTTPAIAALEYDMLLGNHDVPTIAAALEEMLDQGATVTQLLPHSWRAYLAGPPVEIEINVDFDVDPIRVVVSTLNMGRFDEGNAISLLGGDVVFDGEFSRCFTTSMVRQETDDWRFGHGEVSPYFTAPDLSAIGDVMQSAIDREIAELRGEGE